MKKSIKAQTVPHGTTEVTNTSEFKDSESDREKQKRVEMIQAKRGTPFVLPDRVAGCSISLTKYAIPKMQAHVDWKMRISDLYYPHAKGGPLHVDQPYSAEDISRCEKKVEECRKNGVRYTYIKAGDGEADVLARMGDPDAMELIKQRYQRERELAQRATSKEVRA